MKLAPDQVKMFWRLWPEACRANGWTKERGMSGSEIDAKRKELLRDCGFSSLTLVDRTSGFTKVKNKLLILAGVSVQAGLEDQDTTANDSRMHRYVMEQEIIPCLALYVEDVTGYVATVIAGLIRHYKIDRPERPPTFADLSPSQMHQALMTLSARLNDKRKSSGDSLHDMKMKAALLCDCAGCVRGRAILQEISATEPVANPF